jgi:hypothetical protein
MPNVIASATTVSNGTLKRNNFLIGVNTSLQYGPTSATTFWNGIIPAASGYTVYAQKTVNGPSIRTAANDSELITIARQYGGTNITTIYDALSYFNSQTNFMVTNIDYPNIVTSGLTLMVDSGYIPSYPTTGTSWNDLGGNNVNGTLVANPTFNTSNGGSLVFNGTTQYSDFGNNTLGVELQNKSGCAWIYQTTSTATVAAIIDKDFDIDATSYGGWGFWVTSTNKLSFWVHSAKDLVSTGPSITNNTWQHVAFSYNYTEKSVSFYLNGVLNSTITNSTIVEKVSNTTTLKIGAFRNASNFFTGRISNAQVYNRALSGTEILQNYNAQKSRFGL